MMLNGSLGKKITKTFLVSILDVIIKEEINLTLKTYTHTHTHTHSNTHTHTHTH